MTWHRIYWGVVTPTETDGVPLVMFNTEGRCRYAVAEIEKANPAYEGNLRVVRVRLNIETIEKGES